LVDLGLISFTLGLSGWTKNDWAAAGNFDLMAAREEVDDSTRQRVFAKLGDVWCATSRELAGDLGLAEPMVTSALGGWVQAGRAIYDLERGVYRKRELTRDPLPIEALRFASQREQEAARILHQGRIAVDEISETNGRTKIVGRIQHRGRVTPAWLLLDADRRLVEGECTCDYFIRNRLYRGPCDHLLALRAAERRGISDPIEVREQSPSGPTAQPRSSVNLRADASLVSEQRPNAIWRWLLLASLLLLVVRLLLALLRR
jgi:predicted nucleic acid-binding Zn finger protein